MAYATKEGAARQMQRWRAAHPERSRATRQAWAEKNRDRVRAIQENYRERHRERLRESGRLRRHGLTREQYLGLVERQAGRCAICRCELLRGFRSHIDHDHRTGRVRGVLCFDCNLVLGHARDDAGRLASAIAYLRRNASGS